MPVLISACLVGEACRYDGKSKERSELLDRLADKHLIPVCPEVEGGLTIPRPSAEIRGNKVYRENGEEVSSQFLEGANICRDKGLSENTTLAILKSRSPACGCGQVYDGSFTNNVIAGDGIFTQSLKAAGVECISDEDYIENN